MAQNNADNTRPTDAPWCVPTGPDDTQPKQSGHNDVNIGNDLDLHNVMITRFGAMGNVVMTIPVIYSACQCYPTVHFIMVTKHSLTPLFINHPQNLTVVGVDIHGPLYSGLGGAKRLLRRMRESYHIDAYVDLQNDSSTFFLGLLAQLQRLKVARFNRNMRNKRQLTRKNGKVMLPLVSSRARYRETFFKVGLTIEESFDSLYGKGQKADPSLFASIVDVGTHHGASEKWVGIAPFAAHAEKEYPTEKMDEVIRMLIDHGGIHIYIFGGEGRETQMAQEWADKYPQVTSLAGNKYGFPAELALLSNLDAMLTMDSANMHLASLVGTPTVSIWGATHHYGGFKGWRQSENDMVQVPLSCRPCSIKGDRPCFRHDRLCLTAIRPDIVYAKLLDKLGVRSDE